MVSAAYRTVASCSRLETETRAGLVLGWLALTRGSLCASFLCHVAFNLTCGFVVTPLFDVAAKVTAVAHNPGRAPGMFEIVPAWWIVVSIALAVTACVVLAREARPLRNAASA